MQLTASQPQYAFGPVMMAEGGLAAAAALVPAETLARQAREVAAEKTAAAVRKGSNLLRGPSFLSLGA